MVDTATTTSRDWRRIERYVYVERPYDDVWTWLAGHLSSFGTPIPGGGHAVDLRIRPGGMEVSRPVCLHVGGVVAGEDGARAALSWVDATHPQLFPALKAELEIVPVPNNGRAFTQLGILASYRPPFGPLGAIGDRLIGAEVIDATLTTFLDELAAAVERHTTSPSRETEVGSDPGSRANEATGTRRVLIPVVGLAVRTGGAVSACQALARVPGVIHVSLDPWAGLAAVDHDPGRCALKELTDALEPA